MLCGSLIKIWNLANHMKKQNKKHQNAKSIGEKLKTKGLMLFVSFFHVICKISNSNMWTARHLVQASCTELTLSIKRKTKIKQGQWIANQKLKTYQTVWRKPKKQQNDKSICEKTENQGSDVLCFIFFMWFARFQILICTVWFIYRISLNKVRGH